jgi:hypothetical protein
LGCTDLTSVVSPIFNNLSLPLALADEGFITIPEPKKYNLRPNHNVVAGDDNAFLISMYHQLHCLRSLQLFYAALAGNDSRVKVDNHHAGHCFNYIRQGIMCAGDLTLEPPGNPELGKSAEQGWGIEHTCRPWGEILQWTRDHAPL